MKTLIHSTSILVLALMPFLPLPEMLQHTEVGYKSIFTYIVICVLLSLLMVFLLLVTSKNKQLSTDSYKWLRVSSLSFFSLGILAMVPLHMGPPKLGENLLQFANEERFRYLMLLVAVTILSMSIVYLLKQFWSQLGIIDKLILIPLVLCFFISIWDYYDSLMFSSKLWTWMTQNKDGNLFFSQYDFHENWRAVGRILLYVVAIWSGFILYRQSVVNVLGMLINTIFSLMGIAFCILTIFKGNTYYFPFMVPAIALAPSYWISIALFSKKKLKSGFSL